MKKIAKLLLALSLLGLIVYLMAISPKGNDYIEWERQMVKIGQIKAK